MPMIKSKILPGGIEHNALRLGEVARRLSCSRRLLGKAGRSRPTPRRAPLVTCVRVRPTDLADYLERNAI